MRIEGQQEVMTQNEFMKSCNLSEEDTRLVLVNNYVDHMTYKGNLFVVVNDKTRKVMGYFQNNKISLANLRKSKGSLLGFINKWGLYSRIDTSGEEIFVAISDDGECLIDEDFETLIDIVRENMTKINRATETPCLISITLKEAQLLRDYLPNDPALGVVHHKLNKAIRRLNGGENAQ